jgi:hypothetical protein
MGPIALFDKSFLQSLSVDESVWFDHFFIPVVCPLFFVETLADLAKTMKGGSTRTAEGEVRVIAEKTPVLSGVPCVHHADICISNLLGQPAPRIGQIPMAGGRPVRASDGKAGVVFENSPEAEAFARWQREQFLEVERGSAAEWRRKLSELDLPAVGRGMQALGITPQNCKTLEEAHGIAASLVHTQAAPQRQLALLFAFVDVPLRLHLPIAQRWEAAGWPPLAQHASYAAHVLMVELFFQISLAAKLIAAERASNRADIAYLFYVPFCNVFVSSDKLHRRCAKPFLTKQQDFVWGHDLKADLCRINEVFATATEAERQKGLHKVASRPPGGLNDLVVSLWERHGLAPLRAGKHESAIPADSHDKLLAHLREFQDAPTAPEVASLHSDELDALSIERLVPRKKGNWWLIPKDAADDEDRRRQAEA